MIVHPADVQGRDGAPGLLAGVRDAFLRLRHVFADGGYAGDKLKSALEDLGARTIEIVKRSDAAKSFVLLPRRCVVERTFAWLNRNRHLAKDVEATIASATTWLYIASQRQADVASPGCRLYAITEPTSHAKSGWGRCWSDSSQTLSDVGLETLHRGRSRRDDIDMLRRGYALATRHPVQPLPAACAVAYS